MSEVTRKGEIVYGDIMRSGRRDEQEANKKAGHEKRASATKNAYDELLAFNEGRPLKGMKVKTKLGDMILPEVYIIDDVREQNNNPQRPAVTRGHEFLTEGSARLRRIIKIGKKELRGPLEPGNFNLTVLVPVEKSPPEEKTNQQKSKKKK